MLSAALRNVEASCMRQEKRYLAIRTSMPVGTVVRENKGDANFAICW